MTSVDETRMRYERDGFVVFPGLVSEERCDDLRRHVADLIATVDADAHRSVFTTDQQTRTSDEYFLASGDRISYFWEDEALGPDGELLAPKERSINKLGHAMHDLDPAFDAFSRAPEIAAIPTALGMRRPMLLQSMYIFKAAGIGGEVVLHQDATFLRTDPPSVMGLWFALEDADRTNGCLWAVPGAHRGGVRRFFRRSHGGGTEFVGDETPLDPTGEIPLEVAKGTVIALHGCLPHRSDANRSNRSREAYTLHLIEADLPYAADNWLQRPTLPLGGF
jgi:phytanoyl-CoA hydroxylase